MEKLINCKKCAKQLGKRQKMYCSNECKLTDPEGIKQRTSKKEKQDSSKLIRCKITGKTFKDINNYSGVLTRHLIDLNMSLDDMMSVFDVVDNPDYGKERYHCKYCDWTTKDLNNKSGCITVHLKDEHDISPTKHINTYPEEENIWSYTHSNDLRNHFLSKDDDSFVECKECGMKLKKITFSHTISHNMTVKDYKQKHGVTFVSSVNHLKFIKQHRLDSFYPKGFNYTSKPEIDISEYIKSLGVEVEMCNKKLINPYELDIYLPEHNIAIEYNGLYWHSERSGKKLKDYHLHKLELCEKKGIHLIQIFEDEWLNKKEIIKSRISSYLHKNMNKTYARKCIVKKINYTDKSIFLSKNHLQGDDVSKIYLGLFHDNILVSVMTFSKLRGSLGSINKKDHYELSRYASIGNVLGGASKLLSYFIQIYCPKYIISYADRRWTNSIKDSFYEKIGFSKVHFTNVNYWYLKSYHKRYHRYNFTKHRIVNEMGGDPNLTEVENMIRMGYDRIWDCGSIKYEMVF